MNKKNQYITLIVAIAALSLYIGLRPAGKIRYELPTLPQISVESAESVRISRADSDIVLRRDGDRWVLEDEGYRVDESKITSLSRFLENGEFTDLAGESGGRDRFGLSVEERTTVSVTAETGVLTLEFGNNVDGNAYTYAGLPGKDRVYLWRGNGTASIPASFDEFRDRRLTDLPVTETNNLRLTSAGLTFDYRKDDTGVWLGPDGESNEDIAGIVSSILALRASDFLESVEGQEIASWVLAGGGETTYRLYGPGVDGTYSAVSDYADGPVSLAAASVEPILNFFGMNEE